jgi:hypothetical protein
MPEEAPVIRTVLFLDMTLSLVSGVLASKLSGAAREHTKKRL